MRCQEDISAMVQEWLMALSIKLKFPSFVEGDVEKKVLCAHCY